MLKRLLKSILHSAGYEVSRIAAPLAMRETHPDVTDQEWAIYSAVKPYTMLSPERILANIRAVDHIVQHQIPGDIVECGVWRGGSSMAMAMALLRYQVSPRLWMYDTFEGMTEPTVADKTGDGIDAATLMAAAKQHEARENSLVLAFATLPDVRRNMESTGYPMNKVRFIEGPVEQTIPDAIPEQIALLRIDTDWYESTKHELVHLYPRLSPGGILIIDDYGHWQGARKAVDEYFADSQVFLNRIDYTGRLAVKAPEAFAYRGV